MSEQSNKFVSHVTTEYVGSSRVDRIHLTDAGRRLLQANVSEIPGIQGTSRCIERDNAMKTGLGDSASRSVEPPMEGDGE